MEYHYDTKNERKNILHQNLQFLIQIIIKLLKLSEWYAYFEKNNPDEIKEKATELLKNILLNIFPNENLQRLPIAHRSSYYQSL